jgi:leucyl-tRNA synthetase
VPIWVADYVLAGYGTGAIMAVPAHDTRDFEFAEKFDLPIVQVVQPPEGEDWRGYTGDGENVNSPAEGQGIEGGADLNGLPTPEAKRRITFWLESQRLGEGTVQFKLRDWLFSRQRYWGEPFPIAYHENGISKAIPENDLPVALPEMEDFRPTSSDDPDAEPQVPLSRSGDWKQVSLGGQMLRRELNTMPQWAGSCWYYMRFCDPHNEQAAIASDVEQYWLGGEENGGPKVGGVDLYMGGAEHAVLHLLYARFWHKVLYDRGHVSTPEPFHKLFNQGMIQSFAFQREDGPIVARDRALRITGSNADAVQAAPLSEDSEEAAIATGFERWEGFGRPLSDKAKQALAKDGSVLIDIETGTALSEIVAKMSKSLKNVVNPDYIVEEYGADTLRLYEMSMGPLEASKPWNTRDIVGVHRFLQRVWRLVQLPASESDADGDWQPNPKLGDAADADLEKLLHRTIKKVQEDIQRFAFNTAVAQMIVWVNEANKASSISVDQLRRFLIVLAPFAPHICEELWQQLGGEGLICRQDWPSYDEALTRDDEVEIAVQIKGKIRGRITVPADADDDAIVKLATENDKIAADLEGKQIRKAIVVKGRLVNLIV